MRPPTAPRCRARHLTIAALCSLTAGPNPQDFRTGIGKANGRQDRGSVWKDRVLSCGPSQNGKVVLFGVDRAHGSSNDVQSVLQTVLRFAAWYCPIHFKSCIREGVVISIFHGLASDNTFPYKRY